MTINDIKKVKGPRKHKIANSYGLVEYYSYYKKNGGTLSKSDFSTIVKEVNKLVGDEVISGDDFTLPYKMGDLGIRKYLTHVKLVDGKLETNYPIDWDKTIKLWAENPRAAKNKTKVRRENRQIFRFIYIKKSATYNNKSFYAFNANRELKKRLRDNINNNKVDAFILKRDGSKNH